MSVPILGAKNTSASEGNIILFSEGLESRGEEGVGWGFTEVAVCLQSKPSAQKEKDAPARACRSETEFSELCLEQHMGGSCEQDSRGEDQGETMFCRWKDRGEGPVTQERI